MKRKIKRIEGQFRQGDVLIEETEKKLENPKTVKSHVLAHGEVTGHAHVMECDEGLEVQELGEMGVTALVKPKAKAVVTHQEHRTVPKIKKKEHQIIRQRVYTPEAIRNAAD